MKATGINCFLFPESVPLQAAGPYTLLPDSHMCLIVFLAPSEWPPCGLAQLPVAGFFGHLCRWKWGVWCATSSVPGHILPSARNSTPGIGVNPREWLCAFAGEVLTSLFSLSDWVTLHQLSLRDGAWPGAEKTLPVSWLVSVLFWIVCKCWPCPRAQPTCFHLFLFH